ncbi:hypothetical protein C485_06962 [Natrinema altunense JCM 12890]|uniref:Uncharacterized protein n=1 Tax=Natrinema altunense (strain JCM 12890 / CGMCC 1.3731 / AJ2) TaxID=1227494 RepID=L9ZM52_NATA2|nr:hypothetical protein C485_06962 [Natrinema altunense JCM 12890]
MWLFFSILCAIIRYFYRPIVCRLDRTFTVRQPLAIEIPIPRIQAFLLADPSRFVHLPCKLSPGVLVVSCDYLPTG